MTKDILFSPKNLSALLIDRKPCAHADLFGMSEKGPVKGTLNLYATPLGVLVKADFGGIEATEKSRRFSVRFDGRRHPTTLPCTPNGSCQCLTSTFAVEDVLEGSVALLCEENDTPLALGEIHSVNF